GLARNRGDTAESGGARAREPDDRRGVLRERRDYVHRAQRRPTLAPRNRMGADAGEVRSDRGRGPNTVRRRTVNGGPEVGYADHVTPPDFVCLVRGCTFDDFLFAPQYSVLER